LGVIDSAGDQRYTAGYWPSASRPNENAKDRELSDEETLSLQNQQESRWHLWRNWPDTRCRCHSCQACCAVPFTRDGHRTPGRYICRGVDRGPRRTREGQRESVAIHSLTTGPPLAVGRKTGELTPVPSARRCRLAPGLQHRRWHHRRGQLPSARADGKASPVISHARYLFLLSSSVLLWDSSASQGPEPEGKSRRRQAFLPPWEGLPNYPEPHQQLCFIIADGQQDSLTEPGSVLGKGVSVMFPTCA